MYLLYVKGKELENKHMKGSKENSIGKRREKLGFAMDVGTELLIMINTIGNELFFYVFAYCFRTRIWCF